MFFLMLMAEYYEHKIYKFNISEVNLSDLINLTTNKPNNHF